MEAHLADRPQHLISKTIQLFVFNSKFKHLQQISCELLHFTSELLLYKNVKLKSQNKSAVAYWQLKQFHSFSKLCKTYKPPLTLNNNNYIIFSLHNKLYYCRDYKQFAYRNTASTTTSQLVTQHSAVYRKCLLHKLVTACDFTIKIRYYLSLKIYHRNLKVSQSINKLGVSSVKALS